MTAGNMEPSVEKCTPSIEKSAWDIPCIETSDEEELCKRPLVSVNMQTYNHERFIRQAIEGVVMQETDFEYELIIGEDLSSDRTREICFEYQKKHPDKIRVLWADQNVWRASGNVLRCLVRSRGKYVAYCEGDDYWTDPKKLQKQVEYMEAHPGCAMTFHHVWEAGEDGVVAGKNQYREETRWKTNNGWYRWSMEDILLHKGRPTYTLTMMVRAECMKTRPAALNSCPTGDRAWVLWALESGSVDYVPGIGPGVYRKHAGGVWSQQNIVQQTQMHLKSQLIFHEVLPLDVKMKKKLRGQMALEWGQIWLTRQEIRTEVWTRLSECVALFETKYPYFRRERLWGVLCAFFGGDGRFRRLVMHRWLHSVVMGLKRWCHPQIYSFLRRTARGHELQGKGR